MLKVPIAVIIPTYNRGMAVLSVLEKIQACDPQPLEYWVHVDAADGELEKELTRRFPNVCILTSASRMGPGGGRHRCLLACTTPYAVSFDDDSYPVDSDFFLRVEQLFSEHTKAAIFGATVWHRNEPQRARTQRIVSAPSYIGCGYAIRLAAYRQVRGYLARSIPYGMEECDVSLQLLDAAWQIYEAGELRVFHDTELKHHSSPEITAGTVANVALYAFLHYPLMAWGWGVLQLANKIVYCVRMGRIRGILSGLAGIPGDCLKHRCYRKPVPRQTLKRFLDCRRTGAA